MKKQLVIVGAGFGGLSTYLSLTKAVKDHYDITLIDRNNYFLFTPLLHEVATGALHTNNVVEPIERIIGPEVRFIQDSVTGLNTEENTIALARHEPVAYDCLVLALGSTTNFYGIEGAEQYSFVLKDLKDAQRLRDHFITLFQEASLIEDEESRKAHLSVALVGGGPTGVELAAETAELFFDTFKKYYRRSFDTKDASITLINASSTLLRPFSLSSQKYAERVLKKNGVTVMNDTQITEVTEKGLFTQDGERIRAHTIIWTAGVTPESIEANVEQQQNRWVTEDTLELKDHPNIFVLGDMALAPTEDGRGYPMLAQVAQQQGKFVARNIEHALKGEDLEIFSYREKGKLASLGQWHAIAELWFVHFNGAFAWFVWRTIYLVNFKSWGKRLAIVLDWTVNLFSPRDVTKI